MEIFLALLGAITALVLITFVVIVVGMIVTPFYGVKGYFVNKPNNLQKSGFHLFTKVEPGQIKIVERGGEPVRMIMNVAGKRYARVGTRKDPSYWELVSGAMEHPTADIWWPIRWWAVLVYRWTGLVFTDIYPFQKVREYELERTSNRREENGTRELGKSNIVLHVKTDLSDHFRARQFLFPMHITGAEVKGNVSLDIIGVAEMEVCNPHKAAYGTDRWDHAMINLVTDKITETAKARGLDEVLSSVKPEDARLLSDAVERIADDEIICGIKIGKFRLLESNPVVDDEDRKKLQAGALEEQRAKGTRIDGEARADAIRALNEANSAGGDHAVATMEAEALVRAAEAAGKNGGSVILTPSGGRSGSDPTQLAILAELKKMNSSKE